MEQIPLISGGGVNTGAGFSCNYVIAWLFVAPFCTSHYAFQSVWYAKQGDCAPAIRENINRTFEHLVKFNLHICPSTYRFNEGSVR